MKDYELKISQFVDGELSADEQYELFLFLSENPDTQQTLADYMEMKNKTKSFYAGMNVEMDNSKIIAAGISVQKRGEKQYKTMFYFSVAAAILLVFLFLFNQFKHDPILTKYQNLQSEMIKLQENYTTMLSRQMELIKLNNQLYEETKMLKTAQITTKKEHVQKVQKVRSAKMNKQKTNKRKPPYTARYSGKMVASLQNVQTIEITKDDFLGGQVIGN